MPCAERIRYAVLTFSDRGHDARRGTGDHEAAGRLACDRIESALDAERVTLGVLPFEREMMERVMLRMCDEELCDLVVTIGGCGVAPGDVAPDVTRMLVTRELPGVTEAMRARSRNQDPAAALGRAVCGLRGRAVVVNLSGNPKRVQDEMDILLPILPQVLD